MKENFFSKKMTQKSDEELQEIAKDKEAYIDEARFAAIWELKNRNILVDDLESETLIDGGESNDTSSIEADNVTITEEIRIDTEETTTKPNQPLSLYSKKAIYGFSIFFSTIFGAAIMMYNLKVLNQPKARMNVLFFAVLYMILSVLLIEALQGSTFTALILNVTGAFIINEYYWNKYIGKSIVYEPKGLLQAISIAILVVVLIFVLLVFTMPEGLPSE